MAKAPALAGFSREILGGAFDFLKAQHVGLEGLDDAPKEVEPRTDRVDVPADDAQRLGQG